MGMGFNESLQGVGPTEREKEKELTNMGARSHLEPHTTHKEYHKTFKNQDARAQDVCVCVRQ